MFNSVVIKLKALNTGKLDLFPGQKIHALFLKLIREANELEADKLHEQEHLKGFAVSGILGLANENGYMVEKNRYYYIKISTFYDRLFKLLAMSTFKKKILNLSINLEELNFKVINLFFDKRHSKWAGVFNLEEIMGKSNLQDEICMKFYTPTVFKAGDKKIVKIDPKKMYTGLLKKFNKYSNTKIREDITKKFDKIEIKKDMTKREFIKLKHGGIKGSVGKVVFKISTDDQELLETINLLSEFAFYAGVGYKTTMGLGLTSKVRIRKEG